MTNKIEFRSPEECLPAHLVPLAKGEEPLPESAYELRIKLKGQLRRSEPIDPNEIAKVNLFERIKTMQEKTRLMMDGLREKNCLPPQEELDKYDFLAIDWVYSDLANWDDSLAFKWSKKWL